MGMYVKRISKN